MNLYHIEQNLIDIINQLDEQGGEFTQEQLDELELCQENFKNKISSYHQALQSINNDVIACKTEEGRIKAIRQSKEKVADKLKNIMLDAVRRFGTEQKNGVMAFDGDTFKLSTRSSSVYVEDEDRITRLLKYIENFLDDLNIDIIVDDNQELDINGLLDYVNKCSKAEFEECGGNPILFKEYTMDDLMSLTFNINIKVPFYDLFHYTSYKYILAAIASGRCDVNNCTDKNTMKELITSEHNITIGNINNNCSLQIK